MNKDILNYWIKDNIFFQKVMLSATKLKRKRTYIINLKNFEK
jgi:hypothetical protein